MKVSGQRDVLGLYDRDIQQWKQTVPDDAAWEKLMIDNEWVAAVPNVHLAPVLVG